MPRAEARRRRPCCLVSEILDDSGIDRESALRLRRQILEGVILLCRWQLERMEPPRPPRAASRPRRVTVE